jgi:hypothetical protein
VSTKPGGDEVDAHRRERGVERRQNGGRRRGQPELAADLAAAGATHGRQRAPGPHLRRGLARNLERQDDVAG